MPRKKNINCMFCGRSVADGAQLVPAPGGDTAVCIDCVEAIHNMLDGNEADARAVGKPMEGSLAEVPKPSEIKDFLDRYVIGQDEAKRYLAVSVYNH